MNITKKTGYAFFILSAFLSLAYSALLLFNISFALISNIASISFGAGAIILVWQATVQKDNSLATAAGLACVIGLLQFTPSAVGQLCWAFIAVNKLSKSKWHPIAIAVIVLAVLALALSFLPNLSVIIALTFAAIRSAVNLVFSYTLFKSEEDTVK